MEISGFNNKFKKKTRKSRSIRYYLDGLIAQNDQILSEAITLVETDKNHNRSLALLSQVSNKSKPGHRIAITGSPGVGKSTFLESFGLYLVNKGFRVAVLAIDPTSYISKGSILGDKTRMERLSSHPNAFIRPSPSGNVLGGISHYTKECISLCEAAGYDYIFVETVGVGQSEVSVKQIVDMTVLLIQPGAGDDLQGIKRGIVESADLIVVNKADGEMEKIANKTSKLYKSALSYFMHGTLGWSVPVLTCSSIDSIGLENIEKSVLRFFKLLNQRNVLKTLRKEQNQLWYYEKIKHFVIEKILSDKSKQLAVQDVLNKINDGDYNEYEGFLDVIKRMGFE